MKRRTTRTDRAECRRLIQQIDVLIVIAQTVAKLARGGRLKLLHPDRLHGMAQRHKDRVARLGRRS
jgi:hypothetical protein